MDLHGGLIVETRVEADFADGRYVFWLPMPQVIELERIAGASILAIEERLRAGIGQEDGGGVVFLGGGGATVREIREVIRLGLIGGNEGCASGEVREVGPLVARDLVDAYVYPNRPLVEGAALAWRILNAAIFGVQLKKKATAND